MGVKSVRRRSGAKPVGSPLRRSPTKRRRSGIGVPSFPSLEDPPPASATNIKVSVRVRPANSREMDEEGSFRSLIEVVDDKLLIFDPKMDSGDFYFHGKVQRRRDLNKRPQKDHKFTFDRVFSPEVDNAGVFANTTLELVDALFAGYNSSVFVYGATGAGKTFTMLGVEGNPGITFRTAEAIYERLESTADELSCEVSISYLEIYNENVVDLINPGTQALNIREDGKNGVNIPGLSKYKPKTPEELLNLLKHGNSNRSQHPTDANAESSRSHAIFQVFLTQKDRSSGLSADVKVAKLSMIDLAGSERGTVTSSRGAARKKEGANINKSLLALGNCINALAEGSKYIPFRNSKLTRILKDSLGGNCRTVMISNVSPSTKTYEDTHNTLKYSERAKKIKVKLKKNVTSVDFHIAQYAKIVENLQQEISELKEKLRLNEGSHRPCNEQEAMDVGVASLRKEIEALKMENEALQKKAENEVDLTSGVAFQGIKELLKKRLDLESQIKLYHVRMSHCQTVIERTQTISKLCTKFVVSNANKNCFKTLKTLEGMIDKLSSEKKSVDKEYLEAKDKFDIETSSMKLKQEYTLQLDALENQCNSQHLYKFSHLIASERRKDNYLIEFFLPNLISSYLKLNRIDGSYNDNIRNIIDHFCGTKVSWDKDFIQSSNCDSNDQLMGHLYAENVSIGDFLNKGGVETPELNSEVEKDSTLSGTLTDAEEEDQQRTRTLPAPQEKEKHSKLLSTPTSIFDISLEEEDEEILNPRKANDATIIVDMNATQTLCPTAAVDKLVDMNATQTLSPAVATVYKPVDMNATQTLSPALPAIDKPVDMNATQTLCLAAAADKPSEIDLNATHTINTPENVIEKTSVVVHSTHTVPSPLIDSKENDINIANSGEQVTGEAGASRGIRRETFSLTKPTVAVQPLSQSLKTENISPKPRTLTSTSTRYNALARPVSRTPPANGTVAEPRRKMASSKSTSRLLTATDVRFGSSNGYTFGRPHPVPSTSAPSYMASTAASSSRLSKLKENLKPQPSEPTSKFSFTRHLKPKKS